MRILSMNSELDAACRQLGHTVHSVSLAGHGVFSIRDLFVA
jgi:hypothetical protein